MAFGDRKSPRVAFSKTLDARVISIDGTLQRSCVVMNISQSGAKISLLDNGAFDHVEFFLLMSSHGAVHRRCVVVRRYGNEIGVAFVRSGAPQR